MGAITIDQRLIHEVIDVLAPEQTVERVVSLGTSSVVALTKELAIRIARNDEAAQSILRTQKLVDALPDYSFRVPRSAGEPFQRDGVTAVPTIRLWGEPHVAGTGDASVLYELLQEIRATPTRHLSPYVAEPRAFCGGAQWLKVIEEHVVPLLSFRVQKNALALLDALSDIEAGASPNQAVFSHVDLAGTNMLFAGSKVTGILDWDLATMDDPAVDIACLAAWHGNQFIRALARTNDEAEHATLYWLSHPLQALAFSLRHQHTDEQLTPIIHKAETRLLEHF